MPIVRIDIQSGKSTAYKRAILHGVRHGITSALNVPDERVMLRIVETPADDIDATDIRSDRLTIVEISMLEGRDIELKHKLYRAVAKDLSFSPGLNEHDLVVLVNESGGECFFLNGRMACDVPASDGDDEDES